MYYLKEFNAKHAIIGHLRGVLKQKTLTDFYCLKIIFVFPQHKKLPGGKLSEDVGM